MTSPITVWVYSSNRRLIPRMKRCISMEGSSWLIYNTKSTKHLPNPMTSISWSIMMISKQILKSTHIWIGNLMMSWKSICWLKSHMMELRYSMKLRVLKDQWWEVDGQTLSTSCFCRPFVYTVKTGVRFKTSLVQGQGLKFVHMPRSTLLPCKNKMEI